MPKNVEFIGESEHVGCGDAGDSVVDTDVGSEDEAVATYDFLSGRVPDNQLAAGWIHEVEFIDVAFFTCAASGSAERLFTQASDFAHGGGSIVGVDDVDEVVGLIGLSEQAFRRQFREDCLALYFRDYFLHY